MCSNDFIYGEFTVENSDGNSGDFPFGYIKGLSLGIFDITMIGLDDFYKLGE